MVCIHHSRFRQIFLCDARDAPAREAHAQQHYGSTNERRMPNSQYDDHLTDDT